MAELSETEQKLLQLRQSKGYSISETLKELNVKREEYDEIVKKLTELGEYNETEVKKAIARKNYAKNGEHFEIPEQEKEWFQKCKDELCGRYTLYNATKSYNPAMTTKLINSYKKGYSFKDLYASMVDCRQLLAYYQNKHFNSEYGKMSYFMAIIENNVNKMKKLEKQNKGIHTGFNKKLSEDELIEQLNQKKETKAIKKDMSAFFD